MFIYTSKSMVAQSVAHITKCAGHILAYPFFANGYGGSNPDKALLLCFLLL